MTIKSDKWIKTHCIKPAAFFHPWKPMVEPFFGESISKDSKGNKIPSYGLSSYGYDVRIDRNFKVFKKSSDYSGHVDVCNFNQDCYTNLTDVDFVIIEPNGFVLGNTIEKINVPRDVTVTCIGKSTIARSGLHVLVTPLESEWSGYVTVEISNLTNLPVLLKSGIGIMQLQFFQSDEMCEVSYADRNGKYQNQLQTPVDPLLYEEKNNVKSSQYYGITN